MWFKWLLKTVWRSVDPLGIEWREHMVHLAVYGLIFGIIKGSILCQPSRRPWGWCQEVAPTSEWGTGWERKLETALFYVPNMEGNKSRECNFYLSPTDHGTVWNSGPWQRLNRLGVYSLKALPVSFCGKQICSGFYGVCIWGTNEEFSLLCFAFCE